MPYAPTCVCQPEEMRPQTCFVRDERVSFKCLDDLTSVRSVASSNQVEHHVRRSSLAAADRCPRSTPKTSLAFPPLAPGRRHECDVNKPLHCAGGFPARVQQGDSGRLPRQGVCARPPPPTGLALTCPISNRRDRRTRTRLSPTSGSWPRGFSRRSRQPSVSWATVRARLSQPTSSFTYATLRSRSTSRVRPSTARS